jgi:hypothetical protein
MTPTEYARTRIGQVWTKADQARMVKLEAAAEADRKYQIELAAHGVSEKDIRTVPARTFQESR